MEVKNSTLVDKLIEHARVLGSSSRTAMTADRYVVAVINFLYGKTDYVPGQQDRSELQAMLEMMFPKAQSDFSDIREALMKHIIECGGPIPETVSFSQALRRAKMKAAEEGHEDLSAYILLREVCLWAEGKINEYVDRSTFAETITKQEQSPEGMKPKEKSIFDFQQPLKQEDQSDAAPAPAAGATGDSESAKDAADSEENPKEFLVQLTQLVKGYYDSLSDRVLGQAHAVGELISGLFTAEVAALSDKERKGPRASFLFAGPPGVGKTFLAKTAAKLLGMPFEVFDMSEYSTVEASMEFVGSDAVFKDSKEGNFTGFVRKNPRCIVLLDEIEKAHISIIHLLLQILDGGQIRDSKTDEEISLKDVILIFTTNAGKKLYEGSESPDLSGVSRKVIIRALEKDTNAQTGEPFFPAAICSRFASGNVVMFNHLTADHLREIAKMRLLRDASNIEKKFGIRINIDENVYTALLFNEGGNVDGRTIEGRAKSFLHDEIYELFRLIETENAEKGIRELEEIRISVRLPENDPEIAGLFRNAQVRKILLFSDADVSAAASLGKDVEIVRTDDIDRAQKILTEEDIAFALIDMSCGAPADREYLNYEDIESKGRTLLREIREKHAEIPVYLLTTDRYEITHEEKVSFLGQGIESILRDDETLAPALTEIVEKLHQRESVMELAKANKLVAFETAQTVSADGRSADITIFDLRTAVAVDAEDSENIMSSVSKPDTSFDDIIGAEDAKKELRYFVQYLKNPKKYRESGMSTPKGVLMYGPPGTGKTMLAKAMAHESDVTFISTTGSAFVKKYIGEGTEKVEEIFRTARKYAPSIIFIDEIDAIARRRTGSENAHDTESTMTTLLAQMDGFKTSASKPVFVLAATNYDVNATGQLSLDAALLRRFDSRIYIDLPNRDERELYLKKQLSGNPIFAIGDEKIHNLAIRSTGMSLAQLASIIDLAMRTAVREGQARVTEAAFDEAFESFNSGEEKKWDNDLLERVARHEAGHAFICWYYGETPSYITIVARGDHGGYMQHGDNEGKALSTRQEMLARIRTSLGGRASEIVYYGDEAGISTGASGDLSSATNIAAAMICSYGMSDRFGLAVIDSDTLRGSAMTAEIYSEINTLLEREMKTTVECIAANRAAIDAMVDRLMRDNHLTGDEIDRVFSAHATRMGK